MPVRRRRQDFPLEVRVHALPRESVEEFLDRLAQLIATDLLQSERNGSVLPRSGRGQ